MPTVGWAQATPVIQVAVTGKCTKLSVDLIVCLDFVWPLSLPHQHWVLIRLVYGYMLAVGIGKVQVLFRVLNYPGSGSKFGSREPGYPLTSLVTRADVDAERSCLLAPIASDGGTRPRPISASMDRQSCRSDERSDSTLLVQNASRFLRSKAL